MIPSDYILAIKLAITAYVYAEMLTEPGMLLNRLHSYLSRLPDYVFKPLIGCCKCVAGQLAFWVYLLVIMKPAFSWGMLSASIGNHIFFVSLTILTTWIISKAADRLNR
jgi:hypothetical protein